MKRRMARLSAVALLVCALPTSAQTPDAIAFRQALQSLAADFFSWRAVTQPSSTDDVNRVERPEGWTPDYSPSALRDRQQKLTEFRRRLGELRPEDWPTADRVDYLLLRSAIDRVDWELNKLGSAERNPNFYVDQTLGAVFETLVQPSPFGEARTRNLILRLESIPRTVQHARTILTEGIAPFAGVALARLDHIRERMERFRAALAPNLPEAQRARFGEASGKAAAALEDYAAWLRQKMPSMGTHVAVGAENYDWFLRRVALLPYSSGEILQLGQLEWSRSVSFESYARQQTSKLPPATLFRTSAEQEAATRAGEEQIRRFLVEKGIVDVPVWMGHYRRTKTPEYLDAFGYPGVFDDLTGLSRVGQDGYSYFPEPSPNLGFFGLASAQDPRPLIVHEGVPGHYFQRSLSWAHADPIRRQFFDSGPIEGLGFYGEELVTQFGLFDDRPRTLDIIYRFMRLRALRVTADIRLARGEFAIEDAARYLATTVPLDETTARGEAAFFAANPGQAISYQVGKAQIFKFLTDARVQKGDKFDLKEFHNFLWQNGNVPIALQRWEYLGLDDEVRKLW